MTTNCFSSSTGICTTGDRMTTKVRACLPAATGRVEGLDDLGGAEEPVEVAEHQERGAVGRGQRAQRADRGQRVGGAGGRRRSPSARPARLRPRSMSQVARDQPCWRQRRAISAIASSCSSDWTQRPVKAARTYSDRRSASVMKFLLLVVTDRVGEGSGRSGSGPGQSWSGPRVCRRYSISDQCGQDQEGEPVVAAVRLQAEQVLDLVGVEQARPPAAAGRAGRGPSSGAPAGPRPAGRSSGGWSGP